MDGNQREPLGEAVGNARRGSMVDVTVPPEPLVFLRPETAEIIEVDVQYVSAWLQEVSEMARVSDELAERRIAVEEALLRAQVQPDTAARERAQHLLSVAIDDEVQAREAAVEAIIEAVEFNKNGAVWELLPLRSGGRLGGRKFTYVRGDKLLGRFEGHPLGEDDQPQLKSYLTRNDQGKWELDEEKLQSAFTSIKPKLKTSAKEWTLWDRGGEWAPEFAKAFNERTTFGDPAEPGEMTQFNGGATILRFFAGTSSTLGASAGSDSIADALAGKGKFEGAFKVRGEAGAILANAKAEFKLWLPYQGGFHLYFPDGTPEGLDLGHFRAQIEIKAGASCGASLLVEGGLELTIDAQKKQGVRGSPANRSAQALSNARMDVTQGKGSSNSPVEADLGGEITAFAGVQAEASLGGAFQWLKPAQTNWSDFAIVKALAAGQAGAGATAAFSISFEGGKFHVYAKAGACAGVGLKGGCEATVGAMQIVDFFLWYRHQVTNSLDRNIQYFFRDADFKRFCLIHALAIVTGEGLVSVYSRAAYQAMSNEGLHERIGDYIRENTEEALQRIETMTDEMLVALSTVKGYFLYQLDEVGRWLEARRRLLESQLDKARDMFQEEYERARDRGREQLEQAQEQLERTLQRVRVGIRELFSDANLRQEIDNIYQFATEGMGVKGDLMDGRRMAAYWIGEPALIAYEQSVRDRPTPGWQLVPNTSPEYRLQSGMHMAWRKGPASNDGARYA